MARQPEKDHLDDMLDAALAGTFPASDPTSSFVFERERPALAQHASQGAAPGDERKENSDWQHVRQERPPRS
jgi:hypothetical protein